MSPLPTLFLHFFDLHFLEAASRNTDPQHIAAELRLATRLAILAADEVVVPAASYFESPLCSQIIDELQPLFPHGSIRILGGDPSVQEFILAKLGSYDEEGPQFAAYERAAGTNALFPPFRRRRRSATRDITRAWLDRSAAPTFLEEQFGPHTSLLPPGFLATWQNTPAALGDRAFTPDYAAQTLADGLLTPQITARVHAFINDEYFRSFSEEYGAGFVTDLVVLSSDYDLDNRFGNIRFAQAQRQFREKGLLEKLRTCDAEMLLDLKEDHDVAMALLPCIAVTTQSSRLSGTPKLDVQVDLAPAVAKLKATPTGTNSAYSYQRQVTAILDQVFGHSLQSGELEHPINSGRKRIDVKWVNSAEDGLFSWIGRYFTAPLILGECKNYTSDVENPELDQLTGRFSPRRSRFGLLLCRKLDNRALMVERCRDSYRDDQGLVLVLEDRHIEELALMDHTVGWGQPQAEYMRALIDEVMD